MNEKDLLNKLRSGVDDITPPDSLSPEAIEKMLQEQAADKSGRRIESTVEFAESADQKKKKKRKASYYITRYGSLAAVCVLAVTVAWQTNEIARLSGEMDAANETTVEAEAPVIPDDAFSYAENYEEIYNALQEISIICEEEMMEFGTVEARTLYSSASAADGTVDMAADAAVEESFDAGTGNLPGTSGTDEKDFSDTNIQEKGVDEADIVKTDGDYIYILRQDCSLAIVKAHGADSETVSITQIADQNNSLIQEMYLDGNTLNILTSQEITSLEHDADIYYTATDRQTVLYTYDVTDRSAPKLAGTVTQEGYYSDSRKVGPYIYLFTTYYPDVQATYGESTIIPRINGETASSSDFYLPEELKDTTYLVISSVDTTNPDEVLDSKILVSGASNFYVSTEHIYIANETYAGQNTNTEITKFHYADGIITGVAAASVKGYLNDSFSMNEYDGHLRVVTTYYGGNSTATYDDAGNLIDTATAVSGDWTEHNGLFILDDKLQQISSIEDLAAGETIRSARFLGDTGYFVTFRQTDPLFSVDLSDPANPQILGELKISGFSSYLHFYGEDLLLGIGYEADETTGITTGVKLSMFDISDPANVTEIDRLILPGMTWCPAIENYKSILVEPEKNLIGFFCDNRYLTFSWDREHGFTQELIYDFYSDMLIGEAEYDTVRGLYIEDTLYVAGETFLVSFDMGDEFVKTGVLAIS